MATTEDVTEDVAKSVGEIAETLPATLGTLFHSGVAELVISRAFLRVG